MKQRGAPQSEKRPVMRYPGGKFKMTKWILQHFPPHKLYIELYGGAGNVLFAKQPCQGEVYNEINEDIVNVFTVLRNPEQARELKKLIDLTPFSYREFINSYRKNPNDDLIELARKVIYRSFAGIGSDSVFRNAGFRGLKNNETSVTSAQEWSRYSAAIDFFTKRLKNVVIENRPALQVLKIYDRPEALVYADPPYLMSTRSKYSVIYKNEMTEKDHKELADALNSAQAQVILSGYKSPLYEKLYKGWSMFQKKSQAQNGQKRIECLWLSPNIQPRLF